MKGFAVCVGVVLLAGSAAAQWLKIPTAGIPRHPDGRPNLEAPAPRTADGRVSIGGLWLPRGFVIGDLRKAVKGGEALPLRPWADAVYKTRLADLGKDDPTSNCIVGGVPRSDFVPYPFKILDTPGVMVILYEAIHSFRQIFTDGRALPKDPNPAWFGYSVGRWEKDVFVVESAGFNDNVWLDNAGVPATEQLKVTERFIRTDFGHMDIEITIDDPKTYTKPWVMVQPLVYQADNEIIEYICDENNRYFDLVPHAQPPGRSPARSTRP
jgi:hypothetical protein